MLRKKYKEYRYQMKSNRLFIINQRNVDLSSLSLCFILVSPPGLALRVGDTPLKKEEK